MAWNSGLLFVRVLRAELLELSEGGRGLARVNGFGAEGDALFEIAGEAGGDEDGGGVEQNNVASRAGNAGDHVIEQRFVGGHISAGELIDCGAGKAGHLRRDARGFELRFAGLRLLDARDDGLACRGELVNSVSAVDHEGAPGSERLERAADEQERGWERERQSPECARGPDW